MRHWIIDSAKRLFPSWQEAMPQAQIFAHEEWHAASPEQPGIVWCRLRSGESPEEKLPALLRGAGQYLVALCDEPDEMLVTQALAAGAAGCCNTHAAPEVLRQVALVVGNGGLWVGQSLLQRLVGSTARILGQRRIEAKNEDWAATLSEREIQVARLVATGASNKEISSRLDITERTVKAHLTSIFEKLDLRDRLQLSLKVNGLSV